jgi:hypothetical protein
VTVTPGTARPSGSLTRPVMFPAATCESAGDAARITMSSAARQLQQKSRRRADTRSSLYRQSEPGFKSIEIDLNEAEHEEDAAVTDSTRRNGAHGDARRRTTLTGRVRAAMKQHTGDRASRGHCAGRRPASPVCSVRLRFLRASVFDRLLRKPPFSGFASRAALRRWTPASRR